MKSSDPSAEARKKSKDRSRMQRARPHSARTALERHVVEVQRTIRSCEGCGLCCTEAFNSVRILPLEAKRIAKHLRTLPQARREELSERIERSIERHRLDRGGQPRYTCAFLDADLRCALPLHVKPVACLSFNPHTVDRCDQEPAWFGDAHSEVVKANRDAKLLDRKEPIPLAVRRALQGPAQE